MCAHTSHTLTHAHTHPPTHTPTHPHTHTLTHKHTIGKGRLQEHAGVPEKVQLGKELREHIDRALELQPDDCASWTILGAWHVGVQGLGFRV